MIAEIDIAGVFVPTFAIWCVLALGLNVLLRLGIKRFVASDLQRFVWHPPLFDFAILIVLLGAVCALLDPLLL
jgi:hypothetical protein